MADQNITELPVKTSSGITSSDYMLGIDSAEGYQMLIRDLGDYIIRNVQVNTIAGSNQTLKSALDTLNSKMWKTVNAPSSRDYNDFPIGTIIWANNVGTAFLNAPQNNGAFMVFTYSPMSGYEIQMAYDYLGTYSYIRTKVGSTWNAWIKQPTRAEVDALNSKTDVTVTAAEGVQLSNTSKVCVTGTYIFIYVKGKALESKTNAQLCTFGGNKNVYNACTVPIGIGDSEWDITSTCYGFVSGKSIVGRVQENKWFHILITIPFA